MNKLTKFTNRAIASTAIVQGEFRNMTKLITAMMIVSALVVPSAATFAAGSSVDTTTLTAGAKSITDLIKTVCGIAIPVLVIAGFGTLMFSGFSENLKRKAFVIISLCLAGAIGVFLFGEPLASMIQGFGTSTPAA